MTARKFFEEHWQWLLIAIICCVVWALVWILLGKWAKKKNHKRAEKVCYLIASGILIIFIGIIMLLDPLALWFGSSKDDDFDDY